MSDHHAGAIVGVILIAIGVALAASAWFAFPDGAVAGTIAVVLLAAYAMTRRYGYLVPGMIVLGAAIGTGLQDYGYDPTGGLVAVFCGLGFLGLYAVDAVARGPGRWWPVVPGSLLVVFGVAEAAQGTSWERPLALLWPLALVAVGIVLLVVSYGRRSATAGQARGRATQA